MRVHAALEKIALAAAEQQAIAPTVTDFTKVKSAAPQRQFRVSEPSNTLLFSGVKRDYLAREAQNQSLGLAGE